MKKGPFPYIVTSRIKQVAQLVGPKLSEYEECSFFPTSSGALLIARRTDLIIGAHFRPGPSILDEEEVKHNSPEGEWQTDASKLSVILQYGARTDGQFNIIFKDKQSITFECLSTGYVGPKLSGEWINRPAPVFNPNDAQSTLTLTDADIGEILSYLKSHTLEAVHISVNGGTLMIKSKSGDMGTLKRKIKQKGKNFQRVVPKSLLSSSLDPKSKKNLEIYNYSDGPLIIYHPQYEGVRGEDVWFALSSIQENTQ